MISLVINFYTEAQLAKTEKLITTDLGKAFRDAGAFWHKVADTPHQGGTKFDQKRPFDAFLLFRGIQVAVEVKRLTEWKSVRFEALLRPNQVLGLGNYEKASGISYILIAVVIDSDLDKGVKRVNVVIPVLYRDFKAKGVITGAALMALAEGNGIVYKQGRYHVGDFLGGLL